MSAALSMKLSLARTVGAVSRLRGGGTSVPGRVLLGLQKDAIGVLGSRLASGGVLIYPTNGKTTTARMAAEIFRAGRIGVVHNDAGANMDGGVATALPGVAPPSGARHGEL